MTRSRATAKAAGTRMETAAVNYLTERLHDDRIERRQQTGAKDRGDLAGVNTLNGSRLAIEVKDYGGTIHVKPWLDEAQIEAGNADAVAGVVIFKRARIGYDNGAEQGVLMTLATFAMLLEGGVYEHEVVIADPHTVVGTVKK